MKSANASRSVCCAAAAVLSAGCATAPGSSETTQLQTVQSVPSACRIRYNAHCRAVSDYAELSALPAVTILREVPNTGRR